MSTVTERRRRSGARRSERQCPKCGAHLVDDQEWCVECGNATTLIRRPPDWRLGLALVAVVIALVVAGFLIARTVTTPAPAPKRTVAPTRTGPAVSTAQIARWPTGATSWTVLVARKRTEAGALAEAVSLQSAGMSVGVLNSSLHANLITGYWFVYSGRFATDADAVTHERALVAHGHASIRTFLIRPR
jgi:hypothetical protein